MPYKEKPIEKKYYTIGEVAEMFSIATSVLRFWQTEYEQLRPGKYNNGDRKYTKKDIALIRIIYELEYNRGMTIQGVKQFLDDPKSYADIINELWVRLWWLGFKGRNKY